MFVGALDALNAVCCSQCSGDVPSFRGSYWGVVGSVFTRLPEYIKHPDVLQPAAEPFYPAPHYRPHPTLSVDLPNLVDGSSVERYCFGAACTMIADGSALSKSGSGEFVWMFLHYVPVGETDLDNAVAALGVVQVSEFTEGEYTASLGTPTVWLIENGLGSPRVWDNHNFLDIHTSSRKAFCGPSALGWIDKRISGGTQNRITYYSIGSAVPSTLTWANTAHTVSAGTYYEVADVSRTSFPLALGCWSEEQLFGDTTRRTVDRYWQIGEMDTSNGRLLKPDTIDDEIWDLGLPPFPIGTEGCTVNGATPPGRADTSAPLGPDSHFAVAVLDWVVAGAARVEYDPELETDVVLFSLFDSALVNYAQEEDTFDDGLSPWAACFHSFADPLTLQGISGTVSSGSDDYARDVLGEPVGWLRLFEFYGYHNQSAAEPYSPSFGLRYRNPVTLIGYVGYREGTVSEATNITGVDTSNGFERLSDPSGNFYTIEAAFEEDSETDHWGIVRSPRIPGGGVIAPDHFYLVGGSELGGLTWPTVDSTSAGDSREPQPFYDSTGASVELIPPPMGVWRDSGGGIHRGRFAIGGQWDTVHPTKATIYDTGATGYE